MKEGKPYRRQQFGGRFGFRPEARFAQFARPDGFDFDFDTLQMHGNCCSTSPSEQLAHISLLLLIPQHRTLGALSHSSYRWIPAGTAEKATA